MQIEKYSDRLKTLIQSAQTLALRGGHQQLTPLHVLKALLDDEERLAANLIEAAGGSATQVGREVDLELAKIPKVEGAGGIHHARAIELEAWNHARTRSGRDYDAVERQILFATRRLGHFQGGRVAECRLARHVLHRALLGQLPQARSSQ